MMRLLILLAALACADDADATIRNFRTVRLRISAYCSCEKCCGPRASGITASGRRVGVGQCAAPSFVPLGSRVKVDGRWLLVTDRTAKRWRGGTIDVYMPSHREARQHGVKWREVQIERPSRRGR